MKSIIKSIVSQILLILFIILFNTTIKVYSQNSIKVGVLYSRYESDSVFWSNLNSNWSQFGENAIQIDYTSMIRDSIIYDILAQENYDVIIIDNALSNPGQPIYSSEEINAISQYVAEGHGLIVTGGTFRSNGPIATLLGYSGQVWGQVMYGTGITNLIEIIDYSSLIFNNLPSYNTYSNNDKFYSGQDWANDGGLGHLSDWEFVLTNANADIVGMIWNYVSGDLRGSPISILDDLNFKSVFCGHPPVNAQSVTDDYQFVYNMILYSSGFEIVPVELTSFTATSELGKVTLNWTTSTETNNHGFEIERKILSDNAGEWIRIGFVQGSGTTTEIIKYNYVDDVSDLNGNSLVYRLKQIDYNGSYKYSNEITVENDLTPTVFQLYQNYPNPFNPATTISFSIPEKSFVTLKVYDSIGNEIETLVNEERAPGNHDVTFNATDYVSGVYIYSLIAGSSSQTKKMILIK